MKKLLVIIAGAMAFMPMAADAECSTCSVAASGQDKGVWAKNRVVAGVLFNGDDYASARVEFKVKKAKNGVSKVQGTIVPATGKKIKLEKREVAVPGSSNVEPIILEYANVPGIGTLSFEWYVNDVAIDCDSYWSNGKLINYCTIYPTDYFYCTVKDSETRDDAGWRMYTYGRSYIRPYDDDEQDGPTDISIPMSGEYVFGVGGFPEAIEGKPVLADYVPHWWYMTFAEPVCEEYCYCDGDECCYEYCSYEKWTNSYVKLTFENERFAVPKAGKVKFDRKTQSVAVSGNKENPAQLKLKFKAKDSSVKGSMVFYVQEGPTKIKKCKGKILGFSAWEDEVSGYVTIKNAGIYPFFAYKTYTR